MAVTVTACRLNELVKKELIRVIFKVITASLLPRLIT